MFQTADLRRGVATYRFNQHLETVCPGLDGGCIRRYEAGEFGKATLKIFADFTPVVGDVKPFYEAYESGSKLDWTAARIKLRTCAVYFPRTQRMFTTAK